MEFLEPIAPKGKRVPSNFKTTQVSFNLDSFHPRDIMDLHIETREDVYQDVMKYTISMNKLQASVNRLEHLLKNNNSSCKSKKMKIMYLEKQICQLENEPHNLDLV